MSSPDTISVAMCTYNGEDYICDQIDSILSQSLQPDEIVICDDGSDDRTPEILESYADEHEVIRVINNDSNLGISKNFENAIEECNGDLIALADQDDIWHEKKLKTQYTQFQQKDIGLCFHDSQISENGDQVTTLWEMSEFTLPMETTGEYLSSLITSNYIQGASIMLQADLVDILLPIPPEWDHDHYICLLSAMFSDIYGINKCLLEYRRHPNQNYGINITLADRVSSGWGINYDDYEKNMIKWAKIIQKVTKHPNLLQVEKIPLLRELSHRMEYEEHRTIIYGTQSHSLALRLIGENILTGSYKRYGEGPWGSLSLIKDIFCR